MTEQALGHLHGNCEDVYEVPKVLALTGVRVPTLNLCDEIPETSEMLHALLAGNQAHSNSGPAPPETGPLFFADMLYLPFVVQRDSLAGVLGDERHSTGSGEIEQPIADVLDRRVMPNHRHNPLGDCRTVGRIPAHVLQFHLDQRSQAQALVRVQVFRFSDEFAPVGLRQCRAVLSRVPRSAQVFPPSSLRHDRQFALMKSS